MVAPTTPITTTYWEPLMKKYSQRLWACSVQVRAYLSRFLRAVNPLTSELIARTLPIWHFLMDSNQWPPPYRFKFDNLSCSSLWQLEHNNTHFSNSFFILSQPRTLPLIPKSFSFGSKWWNSRAPTYLEYPQWEHSPPHIVHCSLLNKLPSYINIVYGTSSTLIIPILSQNECCFAMLITDSKFCLCHDFPLITGSIKLVLSSGFEPLTYTLSTYCSTAELRKYVWCL